MAQWGERPSGAYKLSLDPQWSEDGGNFWYRNDLADGVREFVRVDAAAGTRGPAFDHARLAEGLAKASGDEIDGERLPIRDLSFIDGKLEFSYENRRFRCDLDGYGVERTGEAVAPEPRERGRRWRGGPGPRRDEPLTSPDGEWTAFVRDHNVHVEPAAGGEARALSDDGSAERPYRRVEWAPDSKTIVSFQVTPGDPTQVHLLESSPEGGGPAKLRSRDYPLPGDRLDSYELNLFEVGSGTQRKPQVDPLDLDSPRLHWFTDGRHFAYEKIDRGHQRLRLYEVDSHDGGVRTLVDEKTETFIWTAHTENLRLDRFTWLEGSDEVIYASEQSGWRHLYLVDPEQGGIVRPITSGEWVVRGIDHIDEEKRQVWFHGCGHNAREDPYFIHHYRVNFDGSGLVQLTEGNGTHSVSFSPDRRFLVDSWSRIDTPPVHELRRTSDGSLVMRLEEADIGELLASGWRAPEVFTAKGRDGETDIWGIIVRPDDFDPAKLYPVIESIYAGPQDSYTPKAFSPWNRFGSLTEKGFVVVKMDGMGTANRSKAFHDVCWQNLKDAGFPDRIAWMKAAAGDRPWMDLDRVGIYGGSAGGQNAAGALLFHPEFYKVGVASCGCHDNRMDKYSWNEQWMGYPVGPAYAESSNIDNAHRLRGRLMLIVGELDDNVPPESTYRLVDALIKAGKDFEFVMAPGEGHGGGGRYGDRRRIDFFVKHLLGQDPPDRNAAAAEEEESAEAEGVGAPPESFFAIVDEDDREVAREFYAKHLEVGGLPVVASAEVDDQALLRTREMVSRMLAGRPDVFEAMKRDKMYLIIIGRDQLYTDMPEYRNARNPDYLNERVRGTGGRPTSFGEEDILSLPLDRYDDESIALHEFCHTIDGALRSIEPNWRERRDAAYANARSKGLFERQYAGSNAGEYWAEICQSYFDCNRVNNWNHGPIGTREQLKAYDPVGYELVRSIFRLGPEQDWRFPWLGSQPSVTAPPERFAIDPHYTKFTWARELPVIGRGASDAAMLRANAIVRRMFAYRHDVLKALINDGVKLVVLGADESLAELPGLPEEIDGLARTMDYDPRTKLVVVAEENVLGSPAEEMVGDSQVIRVLAKAALAVTGSRPFDPDHRNAGWGAQQYELDVIRLDERFGERVARLHAEVMERGMWLGTAAVNSPADYWATGVLAYFDAVGEDEPPRDFAFPVRTREQLEIYDPPLFELVRETMAYEGHVDWRLEP